MKYLYIVLVFCVLSCKQAQNSAPASTEIGKVETKDQWEQDVELTIYDFDALQPLLHKTDDKVYIVNFWATWCGPCVKELPYFEKLASAYKAKNVEVILVSLDFSNAYDTKLKPFIKAHNLKSKVIALHDIDANAWIPKVDPSWSGSIPATIIYNKDKRMFFEQSFTYEELEYQVNKFLN